MQCPRCQRDNPLGQKFCGECGAGLAASCPSCGTSNQPGQKFCGECGASLTQAATAGKFASPESYTPKHLAEKILTSKSAVEGERKIVTVLFVDVSGFTALSEMLDPEDVHQLMDHAFELMLAEIHRYEGTVNQFLGDGLMALFGAPIAHEDHTLRGVHAALGIRRALAVYRERLAAERQIDFRVRIGMNTGPVVVGTIGDNLRMDYTAVGDTTNLAARLLTLAEPGQILVSDEIFKTVGPYFVCEPLGEVAVKGKTLPVRPYRVARARPVRSRLEAMAELGLTPLAGRERDLALLQDRWAEVQAGRGQTVFVFGEAGIGKSRLLAEFRRRAETGCELRWMTGRCVSYGQGISYLPVLDLVWELLGIQEGDRADAILAKVEAGIRFHGDDVSWTVPFIKVLLSLDSGDAAVNDMVPAQRHGRLVEAIRALITHTSQRTPVVVLVEDLHWIDPQSEDVLRLLLEGIAALPVMVLLTYRPGYTPPFGDRTYYTRITLRALPEDLTTTIVEHVLGSSKVPPEVRELIIQRAEGNPLFIEELSKALVENGTLERENGGYRLVRPLAEVVIPETIQGVIMARIDRLADASKSALQIASVIGREFTARLVERVSTMPREAPRALGELRAVELIYEKSIYPEIAYMFKHALTHDVAYESLLKQRRRALHGRVGEVIEELYPDRLAEFYEALAWHYTHGEVWSKAVDYSLKAADKAGARFAYPAATRQCEQAIEILDRHGGAADVKRRALEMLGDLLSLQDQIDPANKAYDRALEVTDEPATIRWVTNKRHRAGTARRDGAQIAYYEHGSGQPTLLLMHPLIYGIGSFQPLLERLCQEFRILTIDPRGVGRSDPLPGRYLDRDHAEDARMVIEATGNQPVVFIGHSRTGNIAVSLATAYPHLVEKLVLIATPPVSPTDPDFPAHRDLDWPKQVVPCVETGDLERAFELFWTQVFSEPGCRNLMESRLARVRQLPPEVIRNFFTTLDEPEFDLRPFLRTLRVPTLVLHGTEDRVVPVEGGRYLADHIPGARFHAFEGRSHAVIATATVELAQLIRSFVRGDRGP